MNLELVIILIWYVVSIFFAVVIHELIHVLMAFFLKVKFCLTFKWLTPALEYSAEEKWWKILLISLSAPMGSILIGFCMPDSGYLIVLKIMFLLNFFNLLPFSSDGESAIYSIMKGKKK